MRKCSHSVYWPAGDALAFNCQMCNPDGTGTGATPVMPRSSADPLRYNAQSKELEFCPDCGNMRTFAFPACRNCNYIFKAEGTSREQVLANARIPGVCPDCGSAVHYATKKLNTWECADCGTKYPAAKRKGL